MVMVMIGVGVVAEAEAETAAAAAVNLPLIPLELQRGPPFYRLFHSVIIELNSITFPYTSSFDPG